MNLGEPTVSIVVCSVGRPDALELCIDGLSRLVDVAFEIVVVLGPGAESSTHRLRERPGIATIVRSPERNLSLSRNLGADAARGALVAFIDDDAYPEECWLADLVPAFADPEVGAVGGETFDYTGYTLQAVTSVCSPAGDAQPLLVPPTRGLTETPAARSFYYPIGTNLVVRAAALDAIGGFDEQFDYYHDETDLARRLLDAGWIVRPLPRGFVFHKFLPSSIRTERRIATDRRSILVNRAYFAVRHQLPIDGPTQVRMDFDTFADHQQAEIAIAEDASAVPSGTLAKLLDDRAHASRLLDAWLNDPPSPRRHAPDASAIEIDRPAVISNRSTTVAHVAIVSPDAMAPAEILNLCHTLADEGFRIHLIEHAEHHTTVDLDEGLWRHRLQPGPGADVAAGAGLPISQLFAEAKRIGRALHPIDVVVGEVTAAGVERSDAVVSLERLLRCTSTAERVSLLTPHRPLES